MLCTRCKKRQAIVFVQRMEGSETKNEGYCLTCARELHIKPLDDMMQRFGVSDQDLEGMEERMNDFMKEMGENGQMPEGMFPMPTEEPDGDNVKIIEAEVCPDHVHMLVEIPPKYSVSSFMGYLKGKSSTMLYEQFGELKYKYRSREFWCRGYYVDTAGKNANRIKEYIKNQLKEDEMGEQLTIGGSSPFTGRK